MGKGASAPQTGLSQQAAEPEVSALRASIPSADALCVLGIKVGLGAALAVTDRWDHYTRNRITALLREIENAEARRG